MYENIAQVGSLFIPGEGEAEGVLLLERVVEGAGAEARVLNGANHIFGAKSLAKHGLEAVLKALGGDKVSAFKAIESAAQKLASQGAIKGVFETTIEVAGHNVTVRGAVIDGIAKLSAAFIP